MEAEGVTTSILPLPSFFTASSASFSQTNAASPMPRCTKVVVEPRAPASSTETLPYNADTNAWAAAESPPFAPRAQPQAARQFQRAPPDVLALGAITETPGLARSSHSRLSCGL